MFPCASAQLSAFALALVFPSAMTCECPFAGGVDRTSETLGCCLSAAAEAAESS